MDDFSADYSRCAVVRALSAGQSECPHSGPVDLGHFLTAMTVVTGFALPLVLAHAEVIQPAASYMSIAGGVLVYGTSTSVANLCSLID
jgi:hypothetical protein